MADRVLVLGATGVIGRAAVEHFVARPSWQVVAAARRSPTFDIGDAEFVRADLTDGQEGLGGLRALTGITHVIYAALQVRDDAREAVNVNVNMLANAIAAVEAGSPGLRRVLLLEGAKAYGVHLGPFKVPALESDSRHMPPNFYYAQEDLLRDLSAEREWDFTVLRPDVVCGKATGVPYNLALLLAVYAIVCRELGLQLKFPGKPATWHQFAQVTDSRLLAQALEWAATEPRCHDQVINITNGDLFQWEHLWPHIAAHFDLAVGTPQPLRLAEVMRDKASLWKDIVGRHGLVDIDFEQLVNWDFGDWVWDCDFPVVSDTLKARELGFNGFVRSTEMFTRIFDELSSSHVIPSSRSLSDPNNSNQSAVQLLTKSLEKSE